MNIDYFEKYGYIFEIVCEGEYLIGLKTVGEKAEANGSALTKKTKCQLEEYFSGKRESFDIPIRPSGSKFQLKVWSELMKIPYGEKRSYLDIAKAIGNPKACRAVGGANNKNPIMIIVPCHRVIGANGALVGYAGGLELKELLLKTEKSARH